MFEDYVVNDDGLLILTLPFHFIKTAEDFADLCHFLTVNPDIQKLVAPANNMTDDQFIQLAQIKSLTSLRLKYNNITNEGISRFIRTEDAFLYELDIEGTPLQADTAKQLIENCGILILGIAKTGINDVTLNVLATQTENPNLCMIDISHNNNITKEGFLNLLNGQNKFERIQARGISHLNGEAIAICANKQTAVEIFCDNRDELMSCSEMDLTQSPGLVEIDNKLVSSIVKNERAVASLCDLSLFAIRKTGNPQLIEEAQMLLPIDQSVVGARLSAPTLRIS